MFFIIWLCVVFIYRSTSLATSRTINVSWFLINLYLRVTCFYFYFILVVRNSRFGFWSYLEEVLPSPIYIELDGSIPFNYTDLACLKIIVSPVSLLLTPAERTSTVTALFDQLLMRQEAVNNRKRRQKRADWRHRHRHQLDRLDRQRLTVKSPKSKNYR